MNPKYCIFCDRKMTRRVVENINYFNDNGEMAKLYRKICMGCKFSYITYKRKIIQYQAPVKIGFNEYLIKSYSQPPKTIIHIKGSKGQPLEFKLFNAIKMNTKSIREYLQKLLKLRAFL